MSAISYSSFDTFFSQVIVVFFFFTEVIVGEEEEGAVHVIQGTSQPQEGATCTAETLENPTYQNASASHHSRHDIKIMPKK